MQNPGLGVWGTRVDADSRVAYRFLASDTYASDLVATVDSSQGCEADVVIVSFVRSSSRRGIRGAAGFLADDRRINVALTRARHQLICVGDASGTLGERGSEALRNLVADPKRRGCLTRQAEKSKFM